jgi:excisionase family DNA binding protein
VTGKRVTISEAARLLGLTAAEIYELIDAGRLRSRRTRQTEDVALADVEMLRSGHDHERGVEVVGGVRYSPREGLALWTCEPCGQPVLGPDREAHARLHR